MAGPAVEIMFTPHLVPMSRGILACCYLKGDAQAIHAALVNRGCLIAPFHNMMLVSPATSDQQIDRLIAAFVAP